MTVYTLSPNAVLHHADCRDAIKSFPSDSLDSCVTDPPYAINFMQKAWDVGDVAFDVEFWKEVLRVLKPGAHVAAFGATRQYHRMACAIEDAGFEIRDSLCWLYGQGFPKSQNVSAFIDKELGAVREVIGTARGKGGENLNRIARTDGDDADDAKGCGAFGAGAKQTDIDIPVTAPATTEAAEFEGFGTALKPAMESIVLARKPLSEPTVAKNVLKWRTGALNIGACRVASPGETITNHARSGDAEVLFGAHKAQETYQSEGQAASRWPANVVTDGSAEVVGMFPNTPGQLGRASSEPRKTGNVYGAAAGPRTDMPPRGDSGSAARFFFNTKETDQQWLARNLPSDLANDVPECFDLAGHLAVSALSHAVTESMPQLVLKSTASPALSMIVTPTELKRISEQVIEIIQSFDERCSPESLPEKHSRSDSLVCIAATREQIGTITITVSRLKLNGSVAVAIFSIMQRNLEVGAKDSAPSSARFHYSAKASKADRNGSKHPTVKPIALMEWLCTLMTPPGGTILDPFAGSGTTGIAATRKGFQVVLCEREAEYVGDIKARFPKGRLTFPLDALRRELALLPALEALRARLAHA